MGKLKDKVVGKTKQVAAEVVSTFRRRHLDVQTEPDPNWGRLSAANSAFSRRPTSMQASTAWHCVGDDQGPEDAGKLIRRLRRLGHEDRRTLLPAMQDPGSGFH
jgi:hypothetical protein